MVRALREPKREPAAADALQQYRDSIEQYQPLSREQEEELAGRIRTGDDDALRQLVLANLKFAVTIALKYTGRGLTPMELISEANTGLFEAAKRFDEARGYKFISYAVWWIRQSIHEALGKVGSVARFSANRWTDYKKLRSEAERMTGIDGREPTFDEVAERLGFDDERVQHALNVSAPDVSLDAFVTEEGGVDWGSLLPAIDAGFEVEFEYDSLKQVLRESMSVLSEREAYILNRYFGLDGEPAISLENISDFVGVTRERTRQLRNQALDKIREHAGESLEDFLEPSTTLMQVGVRRDPSTTTEG